MPLDEASLPGAVAGKGSMVSEKQHQALADGASAFAVDAVVVAADAAAVVVVVVVVAVDVVVGWELLQDTMHGTGVEGQTPA